MTKTTKVIFALLGVAMCVGGALLGVKQLRFINASVTGEGTVTDVVTKESRDSDGNRSVTHSPTVRFKAADGSEHTFTSSLSTSSRPTVGSRVSVRYEAQNPGSASIDSFMELWFGTLTILLIGIVFTLAGIFAKVTAPADGAPALAPTGFVSQPAPAGQPLLPPLPPDLVAFVTSARAQGTSNDSIRQTLVSTGWAADLVDRALQG